MFDFMPNASAAGTERTLSWLSYCTVYYWTRLDEYLKKGNTLTWCNLSLRERDINLREKK
jgi:hypothetical protein